MSAMRKKTLAELVQERAEQNLNQQINTSAYTDKPRRSANNNSEIKTKVDSMFRTNQNNNEDDIFGRIANTARKILNDSNNIKNNFMLGIKKAGESSLSYIEEVSNQNSNTYARYNKQNAKIKKNRELNQNILNGKNSNKGILPSKDNLRAQGSKTSIDNAIVTSLKESQKLESPITEYINEITENDEQKIEQNIENSETKVGKKLAEVTPSIGQSVTGMAVSTINPALGISFWQTSAGGDYTREAKSKGLNDKQAILYGTIMGSMESATEAIGAKLTTGVRKAVFKDGAKEGFKAFGLDVAENFFEEAIMEPVQETVMKITGGEADWSNIGQRMWDSGINGALTSVIMGGASAGIGKATKIITKMENNQQVSSKEIIDTLKEINDSEEVDIEKILVDSFKFTAQDLIKNIDVEKNTNNKIENIARQLSKSEINNLLSSKQDTTIKNNEVLNNNQQIILDNANMPQNSISERIEGINKSEVELTQENSQKLEKVLQKDKYKNNDKAENFFKSAIENNLDVSNEKIEALYDLPNARGIETEFNSKYFEDGNGKIRENINALYVTDREGKRSIIYNPKAQEKSIIEKNAIHETFHDMAGTKESKEVIDFVYDRIKDSVDFHEAYESLKEAYANVKDVDGNILYNKNSKEFENMIKEEAIADYLGTNLGNQEYINELVNGKESRNIAQKIYDAIVSFLDKVTGYKTEEAYLRGLKEKFEKAFNAEYTNQGENSRFSIGGIKGVKNINDLNIRKNALDMYSEAKKMIKEKKSNAEIFKKTGWFRDNVTGELKFNFSDKDMELISHKYQEGQEYKLKEVLKHDLLFEIYPQLEDYKVKIADLRKETGRNVSGRYNTLDNIIEIDAKRFNDKADVEGTFIHEVQHAIQKIEGFAQGTSSKKGKKYRKNFGEVEARDTSIRFLLEKYKNKDLSNRLPKSANIKANILDKMKVGLYNYISNIMEEGDSNEVTENNQKKIPATKKENSKSGHILGGIENSKQSSFSMIRYSNSNIGKWEEFLEKYKINDGTRTTLGEIKLPEAKRNLPTVQESQYQDIINNAIYIPKEEKANLLAELDGVKKNIKSLREFESIVEEMNNTYKQIDNDLLKKQTYNTGNKEIYQSYLKETKKYDMKAVNNALSLVRPNSQGRRTKEQWTTIARQIGTEISNKSNKDIQEIAFRSWQDLRPNSKENLNRQGQKYVDFNSDDWVNTIYDQVEKSRMKFSINENSNNNVKLPESKKIEHKRVELPTNPKIYQDEDVRAFRYATDNIDNISQEDNFAPPKSQDDNLPDTKLYIKRKRTKEKMKPSEVLDSFTQSFVNKGHYIDKLSKQTKNNELKYKYDRTLSTFNEAQHSIGKEQVNSKGEVVGESLLDIFKPIENAKLEVDFEDYLLNKHNISRSIVGKSIYGDDVSAPQSKRKVEIYEQKYPQFKEWSEKVSKYNQNTLKDMADTGMISQETYSNLRTMYGDYVPTYRDIINEKVIFDEDNKVGSNALGKATASNLEILSPKEAMAEQTLTVKKAIRMNELGVELYKTLGKESKVFEGIDFDATAIQTLAGDVIEKAQDGSNTFTIFIDGKMTQFKISDDLYTAFSKDTIQSKIQNNKALNALLTPIEKISKAQRDLLTTYSIGFAVNNPLKDIQDAVFNTKYSVARFGKNYVKALYQMGTKGKLYKQYLRDGGASNTYFEYDRGLLPQKNRIKKTIDKVQVLNSTLEMAPRLAEYISTLEKGGTKAEAMYNAAEITTNFKRGGDITKAMNKYGANFLNASVQGLDKQIRNLSGENGIKGYTRLVARTAMLGVLPSILNHLLLDDDEDYQDLPDYIKDSYYLIPSSKENDKFVRIPKGRVLATIGTTARNMLELAEGEKNIEEAISGSLGGVVNNMAPNNPVTDNLIAPIVQAKNNKAWYDGEIESSRLQKLPVAERTDEKTDEISNKISEALQSNSLTKYIADKIGISPKKINYVIDQYSGGIGDVLLPMSTPYAETNIFEDKFTTSSVLKNKNVENFYTALENAELSKNSAYATNTDQLEYKYLSNISKDVGDLYKEKRDIQSSNLSDNEKKKQTKEIQTQINNIVKEALSTLESAEITSTTANFNGIQYYKDEEDKWNEIKEEDIPKGLSAKTYADYKNKIAVANDKKKKEKDDEDATLNQKEKISILKSTTYSDEEKKEIYSNILGKSDDDYKYLSKLENIDITAYLDYKMQDIKGIEDTTSNIVGKTVSGSKKENLINYLNESNLSTLDKIYILGKSNKLDENQRKIIDNAVNTSNLTIEEKREFYKGLSSSNIEELKDGTIRWKK